MYCCKRNVSNNKTVKNDLYFKFWVIKVLFRNICVVSNLFKNCCFHVQVLTNVLFIFFQTASKKLSPALTCIGGQYHCIHSSAVCHKKQAGKYRKSVKGNKPLTYEMAMTPPKIGHTKSWNSWNTCKYFYVVYLN